MKALAILFLIVQSAWAIDYGLPEESYEIPQREVSIIISPEGYYPQKISVFQGEEVKFFITNTSSAQSCLILKEKNLFISTRIGQITETKAHFAELGNFQFYCPTGKISGMITVLERPSLKAKREIASKKEKQTVRYWLPKDE